VNQTSTQSSRDKIYQDFQQCRLKTMTLFADLDEASFRGQSHPEFSPVGWHLGHIGMTEGYWILEQLAGQPQLYPEYRQLFAADGLPKCDRGVLVPSFPEVWDILNSIRTKVFTYLETAPLDEQERLWRFIIQHESMHNETIAFVLQMQNPLESRDKIPGQITDGHPVAAEMLEITAGEFDMGSNSIDAMDNERPAHRVYLDTYWIDRYPVTCGQYRKFIADGGYQNESWWSPDGWKWLQENPVVQPLYWHNESEWENHPVCGVSWYEAEAYARYVGKRLPTEAEWEKAACWDAAAGRSRTYPWGEEMPSGQQCNCDSIVGQTTPVNAASAGQSAYGMEDALGNVWEWTGSWFDGYEGFAWYPYLGYSQPYFDNQHRVIKGASWATRPWAMRASFRNWYHPGVRQILAGFRCASSQPQ